jgi:hypothetical protein
MTRWITHQGHCRALCAWAERTGIKASTIAGRLNAGWTVDEALTRPEMSRAAAGRRGARRSPWRGQRET